jgi:TolB-like protein/DNA-binding winged helix-turn-helix (wHTH) protein/lipoprotein NlpI
MIYEFSDLVLDLERHRLTRDGQPIKLTKLSFKALQALVQAAPALIPYDDLIDQVWGPNRVITPDNLSQRMKTLRQSLGDDPNHPIYIEGVRGEGYRLIPTVQIQATSASSRSSRQVPSSGLLETPVVLAVGYTAFAGLVLALSYFAIDRLAFDSTLVADGTPATERQPADTSIAVLPFVNMSSDAEQEYFSDGLSEELLNLLAKIPELKVAARTSSFSVRGKGLSIPEIADQLNVVYVLEGSVRKQGEQLRITAQLVRADNGFHLWSETYDRQLDNVFEIQEDIATAVTEALKVSLLGDVPKVRKTEPEAYRLFLEGQYLKRQISLDSLNRAVRAFEQAIEIDPTYAPALAELADALIWGGGSDRYSYEVKFSIADQSIKKAIESDPDYAFAYYVRGISSFFTKGEFEQGFEDFEHALELDPDNAILVAAIGKGAFLCGKFELAISQYEAALAMDPVVPEFHWFLGRAYLSAGLFDEAEAALRKLSSLSSTRYGDGPLFETLVAKGELEAAQAMADTDYKRALLHHAAGNTAKADEALARVVKEDNPYEIAAAYGHRGETEKVFEWLDTMLEQPDFFTPFILTERAFLGVHSDPRWDSVLQKLGLLGIWKDR